MAYITVGTGIGVGLVVNGRTVHGLVHPEGGHVAIQPLPEDQDFEGVCQYHKCCLEGFCTNRAIAKRKDVFGNAEMEYKLSEIE